jgi:cytochrome b subunit of formate dehydrogenase
MTMLNRFPLFSRVLHWAMAALILAMLFIGVGMVSSLSSYQRLVAIHKPMGILIRNSQAGVSPKSHILREIFGGFRIFADG